MRSLLALFSTVAAGSLLAAVNFAPIVEVQRFVGNRRRFVLAVLLGAASIILFAAMTLLSVVDLVIQYEKQGGIVFNGLLLATSIGFIFAFGILIMAQRLLPSPKDFLIRTSPEAIVTGFQNIFKPLLENFNFAEIQKAMSEHQSSAPAPTASQVATPDTSAPLPRSRMAPRPEVELAH